MKRFSQISIILVLLSAMGFLMDGCMHDPDIIPVNPMDTSSNSKDTTGTPCDPNIIYFNNQVLPLLQASCALAGCHDPVSKEDGVVLNSFENVIKTGDIKAFNPGGSKLYKMITESNPKDRMPPPPMNSLTADQKKLIFDWISQGAKSEFCDQPKRCDTIALSFTTDILPIFNTNCKICHSGATPSANISLSNYSEISTYALNGKLVCVINWNSGCVRMPSGGNKLNACSISQIEAWINQGIKNN